MSFTPVLSSGGYSGWVFLKRTMTQQFAAFAAQASVQRDEAYFREKIGSVNTAEQLINDSRLLRVALGAFGLDADIRSKFFIKKVLEEGTLRPDALANKLANKQYQKLASAFGFGNFSVPRTKLSDFADEILHPYNKQQFSVAVGAQSEDMRLALNIERELPDLAMSKASPLSKWFTVLGNPPMRAVFERAFGLPRSFGTIDLDKQVQTLQARSTSLFGSADLAQFSDSEKIDKLVKQFFLRSAVAENAQISGGAQVALTLLQQSRFRFG